MRARARSPGWAGGVVTMKGTGFSPLPHGPSLRKRTGATPLAFERSGAGPPPAPVVSPRTCALGRLRPAVFSTVCAVASLMCGAPGRRRGALVTVSSPPARGVRRCSRGGSFSRGLPGAEPALCASGPRLGRVSLAPFPASYLEAPAGFGVWSVETLSPMAEGLRGAGQAGFQEALPAVLAKPK